MKAQFINKWDAYISGLPQEIKDTLKILEETPQRADYHPEGNCLEHVKLVFYEALKTNDVNLVIAAIFHDLGKAYTTKMGPKGFPISYGHEHWSAKFVLEYQNWIDYAAGGDSEIVYYLVSNHMRIHLYDKMRMTKQNEMKSHPHFELLKKFGEIDNAGRG